MAMSKCLSCNVELDQPDKPETADCGGDCKKCIDSVEVPWVLSRSQKVIWFEGWKAAVIYYAVWKDGEQLVGVMQRPLADVIEQKRKMLKL